MNLGVATAIGALAISVFALSSREPEFGRALDIAAAGAGVWTVTGAAAAVLTFSSLSYTPLSFDDGYGQVLGQYLTANEIGRAWLTTVLLGAAITVLCFAVRNQTVLAAVAILSVVAVIPLAQQGHAGDRASHDIAITAVWLHISAASVWLGGLLTVVLLRRQLDDGTAGRARL